MPPNITERTRCSVSLFSWGSCEVACCIYAWSDHLSLGMVIMNCIATPTFEGVITSASPGRENKYGARLIGQFIDYHGEQRAIHKLNEITRSHLKYGVFYHHFKSESQAVRVCE